MEYFDLATPLRLPPMFFYVKEPCKDWFEHFNHEEGNAKDYGNISVIHQSY